MGDEVDGRSGDVGTRDREEKNGELSLLTARECKTTTDVDACPKEREGNGDREENEKVDEVNVSEKEDSTSRKCKRLGDDGDDGDEATGPEAVSEVPDAENGRGNEKDNGGQEGPEGSGNAAMFRGANVTSVAAGSETQNAKEEGGDADDGGGDREAGKSVAATRSAEVDADSDLSSGLEHQTRMRYEAEEKLLTERRKVAELEQKLKEETRKRLRAESLLSKETQLRKACQNELDEARGLLAKKDSDTTEKDREDPAEGSEHKADAATVAACSSGGDRAPQSSGVEESATGQNDGRDGRSVKPCTDRVSVGKTKEDEEMEDDASNKGDGAGTEAEGGSINQKTRESGSRLGNRESNAITPSPRLPPRPTLATHDLFWFHFGDTSPIGMAVERVRYSVGGPYAVVSDVEDNSPALRTGVKVGDVIAYPGSGGASLFHYESFLAMCKRRPVIVEVLRRRGQIAASSPPQLAVVENECKVAAKNEGSKVITKSDAQGRDKGSSGKKEDEDSEEKKGGDGDGQSKESKSSSSLDPDREKRVAKATAEYYAAFHKSNALQEQKVRVQHELHRMVHKHRMEMNNKRSADDSSHADQSAASKKSADPVVDPATGETRSQYHKRAEAAVRGSLANVLSRLVRSEEDRKEAWRKLIKVEAECEEAPANCGSHYRREWAQMAHQNAPEAAKAATHLTNPSPKNQWRSGGVTVPCKYMTTPPNAATTGSDSKYSAERLRARKDSDGSVRPATTPKRDRNGLYMRPAGRRRLGMNWDAVRGVWIPAENPDPRFGA